ncbi:MAG: type II and III secretion system family protein [Pseudobdellovibrionaceae bacterium]|jgi:hypothetical protein|nr:type II and III secretion system family protein [Pseudobdellovibrionaceae bacterium]
MEKTMMKVPEQMSLQTRKSKNKSRVMSSLILATACMTTSMLLLGCADVLAPAARNVNIPSPKIAEERVKAVNENGDPVIYLPLGEDVLVPQTEEGDPLPSTIVGPFELRGETLAGALQLVMDGTNIPIAFEADDSLSKTITVTNLRGPLDTIVHEICSLGDMYCSYQSGILVVKDTQVFTVSIPPITAADSMSSLLTNISAAVGSITGTSPITDASTRTIVYRASQRTSELARRYFQRLRSSTALVVFETYVWEVSLDSGNTTGIKWSLFDKVGRFKFGVNVAGAADPNVGSPISIGLPTTGSVDFDVNDVFQFVSSYGAVKTVSQPQITVLSGSSARLRVADTQNYVASLSRTTTDGGTTTVSTTTDSVDSGFTLEIGSNWDNSTVYGDINILLQEVRGIDTFDDNPDAVVQLPQTTERELETQVRIRPGDLLLIAGLVRETDSLDKEGIGTSEPSLPFSRAAQAHNTELVFLMRPRVVVFTAEQRATPRKGQERVSYIMPPQMQIPVSGPPVAPMPIASTPESSYVPAPELPSNPVSVVSKPVVDSEPSPEFNEVITQTTMEERKNVPEQVVGEPVAVRAMDSAPSAPSVEVNMPDSVENEGKSDPSVIVNYDVLGQ